MKSKSEPDVIFFFGTDDENWKFKGVRENGGCSYKVSIGCTTKKTVREKKYLNKQLVGPTGSKIPEKKNTPFINTPKVPFNFFWFFVVKNLCFSTIKTKSVRNCENQKKKHLLSEWERNEGEDRSIKSIIECMRQMP